VNTSEKAYALYKEIIDTKSAQTLWMIRLGEIFKKIRDEKLYKHLDSECTTFQEFTATPEIGYQKSTVYSFIKIYEVYIEKWEVTPETLCSIGHRRLQMLLPLIDGDPEEWLGRAQTWSDKDFINAVREAKGRPPMPDLPGSTALDTSGYDEYVKSHPCILHPKRTSERAHFPRTVKMGGKLTIPLCRECHAVYHDIGVDTFFSIYKVQIGKYFENLIAHIFKEDK